MPTSGAPLAGIDMSVDRTLPADQAMLLRLIDSKFETIGAKLDGVAATLVAMTDRFSHYDTRFDEHEKRLASIDAILVARTHQVADLIAMKASVKANADAIGELVIWRTREETTAFNASKWGGAIWTLVGSAVTAILGWIILSFVNATNSPPAQVVAPPQIEHSRSATVTRVEPQ